MKTTRLQIMRIILLYLLSFFAQSCGKTFSDSPSAQPNKTEPEIKQQAANQQQKPRPLIEAMGISDPKTRKAWEMFTESGIYRWAQAGDFHIPEWAMEDFYLAKDIERQTKSPFQSGDINSDNTYEDFAVIVIDTTKQNNNRYSLVIFNEPKGEQEEFTMHWLIRDTDLSRTVLSIASDSLSVREYCEDCTIRNCSVKWNKQKNTYSCKWMQIPSLKSSR